jgi:ARG and Rhodanese-Phosphatase-superfamily-associated Protein domain
VFPLLSEFCSSLDYLMLAEGLRRGLVTVREISEGGSVPDLVVENRADVAVLIVDGEELVGAKQNRVANLSVLIPAEQTTTIPVSCVEQGRWADASRGFTVTEHLQYARGRAEKLASVQRSMRSAGTRRSDQAQVWNSVREKAAVMGAESPTEAMSAIFERHSEALDGYVEAFAPQDGQVGAIFVVGIVNDAEKYRHAFVVVVRVVERVPTRAHYRIHGMHNILHHVGSFFSGQFQPTR